MRLTERLPYNGATEIGKYSPPSDDTSRRAWNAGGFGVSARDETYSTDQNDPFNATLSAVSYPRLVQVKYRPVELVDNTNHDDEVMITQSIAVPADSPTEYLWDGRDPDPLSSTPGAVIRGTHYMAFKHIRVGLLPNGFIVSNAAPGLTDFQDQSVSPSLQSGPFIRSNPRGVSVTGEQVSDLRFQVDQESQVTVKLFVPGDTAESMTAITYLNDVTVPKDTTQTIELSLAVAGSDRVIFSELSGDYTYRIEATSTWTGETTIQRGFVRFNP